MKRLSKKVWKTGIIIFSIIGVCFQCNRIPDNPPVFQYPGFDTQCIFIEDFDGIDPQWKIEGAGTTQVSPDSGLIIAPFTDSLGVIIWLDKDFENSYQVEYQLNFNDTLGMHLLYAGTAGLHDENALNIEKLQPGAYESYSEANLKNYQISMHCYDLKGEHHAHSRLRKNPGNILLSHIPEDPCRENRQYTIDFIKTGNRLQLFVDGKRYHDFRDKGDRKSLYNKGKIGFWFSGKPGHFTANIMNIRVYALVPN